MKRHVLILLAVIGSLGLLGFWVLSLPKLGEAPSNTVIPELTEQEVLDKLVDIKGKLQRGEGIDPNDLKFATRLMNVRTLTNVKGEIKVQDVLEK